MKSSAHLILENLEKHGYGAAACTYLILFNTDLDDDIAATFHRETPVPFDGDVVDAALKDCPARVAAATLNRLGAYGDVDSDTFYRLFSKIQRRVKHDDTGVVALSSAVMGHVARFPDTAERYAPAARRWVRDRHSWPQAAGLQILSHLRSPTRADVLAIFAGMHSRSPDVKLSVLEAIPRLLRGEPAHEAAAAASRSREFKTALGRCCRSRNRLVRMAAEKFHIRLCRSDS